MEGSVDAHCESVIDEELNALIGDYSIPHVAELGQDSVLAHSQYAKVIFHDIADTYPTDADICCKCSLTDGVTVSHGDRIALYRVGWSSIQEHVVFELVPVTDAVELQVLFKASSLPKDEDEFYQLCYVTVNGLVCGASVPFQFRHLYENELCAVEEQDGLMVVRSITAFTEEKLREALVANELLQKEKESLEKELKILEKQYNKISAESLACTQKLTKLETEKESLEKKLEDNSRMECHVERLKKDLLLSDKAKNDCFVALNKAEQHIQVLTAAMDTVAADKEHMARQLQNGTRKELGAVAQISHYKLQIDNLTHMLEALTQSKKLVTQEFQVQQATNNELRDGIQNLEMEKRAQENTIAELQKEKKILEEQVLSAGKMSEKNTKQINNLEREKEHLLRELVQSASQREKQIKEMREVHEGNLKSLANEREKGVLETSQINICLKQQLQEAQNTISEKEQNIAEITGEKASLEARLKQAAAIQKELMGRNEDLVAETIRKEYESAFLKMQLEGLNEQCGMKAQSDLEHRIINLKLKQEEITADKNVQQERIDTIAEQLSILDVEAQKLHCERKDVAAICDTQENELVQTVGRLMSLKESLRKNYVMLSYDHDDSTVGSLKAAVSELEAFVESSKMRISDIDERIKEVEEDQTVLMQQQSLALKREHEYKKREEEVHQQLTELQELEPKLARGQGGQLAAAQDQFDHISNGNSDVLATGVTPRGELAMAKMEKVEVQEKWEESNCSQEQQCSSLNATVMNTCLAQKQELKFCLQLAAAEYRKLYTEKQKVERRLTKLYHKMNEKKIKSALEQSKDSSTEREQPVTGELIHLSQATVTGSGTDMASPAQEKSDRSCCSVCPICSVTFPPGAFDLFTQHFDSHLS